MVTSLLDDHHRHVFLRLLLMAKYKDPIFMYIETWRRESLVNTGFIMPDKETMTYVITAQAENYIKKHLHESDT